MTIMIIYMEKEAMSALIGKAGTKAELHDLLWKSGFHYVYKHPVNTETLLMYRNEKTGEELSIVRIKKGLPMRPTGRKEGLVALHATASTWEIRLPVVIVPGQRHRNAYFW